MNHNLFISYSRVDSEFVLRLVRDLRTLHIELWFDQIDIPPGANWDDEIERALDQAKIMIVVLSESSGQSQNVRNEIGHALDQGKQIVPVLLSKGTVPLRITRLQREDFSGDYQTALAKLTRRLSGEGKTASLEAISSEDMRNEARVAAVRLSAGRLPEVPSALRDDARMRPSEPELLSSLASVTAPPPSGTQWKVQRLLPIVLSTAAVAGAAAAMLRSPPSHSHINASSASPLPAAATQTVEQPRTAAAIPEPKPLLGTTVSATEAVPTAPGRGAILCSEPRFGGDCESITKNADLRRSRVGNDTVSSIQLGTCVGVRVCSNIEFGGTCVVFKADKPELLGTRVGDNSISSVECLDGSVRPAGAREQ